MRLVKETGGPAAHNPKKAEEGAFSEKKENDPAKTEGARHCSLLAEGARHCSLPVLRQGDPVLAPVLLKVQAGLLLRQGVPRQRLEEAQVDLQGP